MARDMNPNNVKKSEVDEVFLATAREVVDKVTKRRVDPLLIQTDAQHRAKLDKAQAIVDKANARKGKGGKK